jgi:two-component system chemotaxis response regulator CheB
MRKIRVLLAEDAAVIRRVVCEALQESGQIEVVAAAVNGKHAVELFARANPEVAVLDMEMPEMNGLETMAALRALRPTLPIIMFSALTQQGTAATMQALFRGANDYVAKPTARAGGLPALRERLLAELIPKIRALAGGDTPAAPPLPDPPRPAFREMRTARVDVVAIGCSTGGPAALRTVLCGLLQPPPVPVLVVQHISSTFSTLFARGLGAHVPFPVTEARADEPLLPGRVYVAPGDHHLSVDLERNTARARLNQGPVVNSCRPSVDVLFRGVAQVYGVHALAVVMTGMGSDGLAGCRAIADRGGHVLIQDRASSVVWGMPGAVARAGLAHRTASLSELAPTLTRLLSIGRHARADDDPKRGAP